MAHPPVPPQDPTAQGMQHDPGAQPAAPDAKAWAQPATGQDSASLAKKLEPGETPGTSKVPFQVREDGDDFKASVRAQVGSVARQTHDAPIALVNLHDLQTPQHTVNDERLMQHLDNPGLVPEGTKGQGHGGLVDRPIVIRQGGQLTIWDGNHRLTAAHLKGQTQAKVRLVDLDKNAGGAGMVPGDDRAA